MATTNFAGVEHTADGHITAIADRVALDVKRQMEDSDQYIHPGLTPTNLVSEEIIQSRNPRYINPEQGPGTAGVPYGPSNNELSFELTQKGMLPPPQCRIEGSLQMYTKGDSGVATDVQVAYAHFRGIESLIQTLEIHSGSQLLEQIEYGGALYATMIEHSCDPDYADNELSTALYSGAKIVKDKRLQTRDLAANSVKTYEFAFTLNISGVMELAKVVPTANMPIRITIRLSNDVVRLFSRGYDKDDALIADLSVNHHISDYGLFGLKMYVPYLQVAPAFSKKVEDIAVNSPEKMLNFPFRTFDTQETLVAKDATEMQTSLTAIRSEVDAIFIIPQIADATKTNLNEMDVHPIGDFTLAQVSIGGYYITPPEGYSNNAGLRMALEEALNQANSFNSSSSVNRTRWNTHKMLGFNCAKVPAEHNVMKNGVNARNLGGKLDIKLKWKTPLTENVRFLVFTMFRRFAVVRHGAVRVLD